MCIEHLENAITIQPAKNKLLMVGIGFVAMMVRDIYKVQMETLIFITTGLLLNINIILKILILYGVLEMMMALLLLSKIFKNMLNNMLLNII